MSLTVGELNAVLGLDQGPFDRGLRQSERKFGGLGGTLAGMAKKAAVGVAAGLAGGAVAGVNTFANLERGMNEVFTLLPGISKDAMGQMTGQVKDFATEFGTLPSDVVPALYQSLSAGVPKGNVFEFLETAQQAATGGVTDLATAVDGISSVVNAYGDQIGGATEASDLMFTAVRMGKTTMGELASSLSNVTPIAAANNVAFSDITAALATMTSQGIPTAQATTQIRQAIVELSDAGTGVGKTFEELAGKSFRDFMAEGGSVADALGMLEDHAGDTGVSVDQLFGSVEAGGAALALSGSNAEKFASNVDEMANSAGATEKAYETMDQGIGRSFDRIKASGSVALANVGEALAPLIASVAGFAEDTLPRLAEQIGPMVTGAIAGTSQAIQTAIGLWQQFKVPILVVAGILAASYIPQLIATTTATVVNLATQAGAWVAARGKALASIATQVAGMAKLIAKYAWMGVQALAHAAKVAASWIIAMGPVGWVIAAVVGLVALIIANWDKVKRWTKAAWEWISEKIAAVWRWITRTTTDAVNGVVTWFRNLRDRAVATVTNLRDRVVGFFTGLKDRAIAIVVAMVSAYLRYIFTLRDTFVRIVTTIRDRVVAGFRALKDGAVRIAQNLVEFVRSLPGRILDGLGNLGSLLIEGGKNLIRGLIDGIKSMASAPVDAVKGIVGRVRNLLPFSPAKDGPLSGSGSPKIAGAKIAAMMASGILSQTSSVAAAADRMASAAVPNLGTPLATYSAGTPAGTGVGEAGDGQGGPLRLVASGSGSSLLERTLLKAIQQGLITLEAETA